MSMYRNSNARDHRTPLTVEQVAMRAPSVLSMAANPDKTSDRYTVIPTAHVIAALEREGFMPVWAGQTGKGEAARGQFQKHLIVLRHRDALTVNEAAGGLMPEILLTNSHDGSSSYQLTAGLFRMVCSNGLIAGDTVAQQRVPHRGDVIGRVIEGAYEITKAAPLALQRAEAMRAIALTHDERRAFAEAAALTRWDATTTDAAGNEIATAIPSPEALLTPRRYQDREVDLWTTFNVVQEHIIRGGDRMTVRGSDSRGRATVRRTSTREVTGIDARNSTNKALWLLAERMAELKGVRLAA